LKKSAGILLYKSDEQLKFFLVHPGGPYFIKKDEGAWSIPKGEFLDPENPLHAAKREFKEETGFEAAGNFIPLSPVKQKNGKIVYCFAVEGSIDADRIVCNTFSMEWPPRSGISREFPEVDKGGWFTYQEAIKKIIPAQLLFIDELIHKLNFRDQK